MTSSPVAKRSLEEDFYQAFRLAFFSKSDYLSRIEKEKRDSLLQEALLPITGVGALYHIGKDFAELNATYRSIRWLRRHSSPLITEFNTTQDPQLPNNPIFQFILPHTIEHAREFLQERTKQLLCSIALKVVYVASLLFALIDPVQGLTMAAMTGASLLLHSSYINESFLLDPCSKHVLLVRDLSLAYDKI